MRIIAGKNKRTSLYSVPGDKTRPTTDFIRELIFSVIQDCNDLDVLDLYAGSGSMGLEALSRGAAHATFVDVSERSIKTINKNIAKLNCRDISSVYKKRASAYLKNFGKKHDLIFIDPPYDKNLINSTLELILENNVLNANGMVVVEHSLREEIDEKWASQIIYQKRTGSCSISIFQDLINKEEDNENI